MLSNALSADRLEFLVLSCEFVALGEESFNAFAVVFDVGFESSDCAFFPDIGRRGGGGSGCCRLFPIGNRA